MPASALVELPEAVDDGMGAMVEPGGNAWRAVVGAGLTPGDRVLILGPGTIGLLCAMFARAAGAQVHLLAASEQNLPYVRSLGFDNAWTSATLPSLPWDAVIDASNAAELPARALELVEPGKRVVYIGLAGTPSLVDTRHIALKDVTAVGVLSASGGLRQTIAAYASGDVDPRPLIAATVPLEGVAAVLGGERPSHYGSGPKFHVTMMMADNEASYETSFE